MGLPAVHGARADAPDEGPSRAEAGGGPPRLGDQVLQAVSPHVSPAVREVIAKAMQAAGLKG